MAAALGTNLDASVCEQDEYHDALGPEELEELWQLEEKEILDIAGEIGDDWMIVGIQLGYTRVMLSHLEDVYPRQPKWRNFMMIAEWCDIVSHLGLNVKQYLASFLAATGHSDIADTLGSEYNRLLPEAWLIGNVIPLFKNKGSESDPQNYMPITLLSTLGNFFEKRATIVSASIPKYVSGIDGCTTQAFPGATIGRLTELISSGKVDLISLDFVIVHVGSNNISSSQSVDTIISYFGDLIHKLKKMTFAKLIFTSILPRPVDHMKTGAKVNKVNTELKRLCKRNNLLYCNLYRSFLLDNIPDASLFAPRDGLHLNFAGTELFRKKIINIIKHQSI